MGIEIRTLVIEGNAKSFKPEQKNNIYLLVNGKKAVLVDGCYDHEQSRSLVSEQLKGLTLTDILVTHFHPDHAESAARIRRETGAALWAHPYEVNVGGYVKKDEIDRDLSDGLAIETGAGFSVRAVGTPGHTMGHTCFFLEDALEHSGVLFTGDHVIGEGTSWVGPPHGSIAQYMDSLRKINELPLKEIRGGHGPLVTKPHEKIDEYYEHRLMRERQILKALETGAASVSDLVDRVYADTIDPKVRPLAAQVVKGHLEKLTGEKRAAEFNGRWELAR